MIALLSAPTADAAHDAAARFRQGAYSVTCPTCHVPAGVLCLARRSIHPARRGLYLPTPQTDGLVTLLVGRAR